MQLAVSGKSLMKLKKIGPSIEHSEYCNLINICAFFSILLFAIIEFVLKFFFIRNFCANTLITGKEFIDTIFVSKFNVI